GVGLHFRGAEPWEEKIRAAAELGVTTVRLDATGPIEETVARIRAAAEAGITNLVLEPGPLALDELKAYRDAAPDTFLTVHIGDNPVLDDATIADIKAAGADAIGIPAKNIDDLIANLEKAKAAGLKVLVGLLPGPKELVEEKVRAAAAAGAAALLLDLSDLEVAKAAIRVADEAGLPVLAGGGFDDVDSFVAAAEEIRALNPRATLLLEARGLATADIVAAMERALEHHHHHH
uniref:De novo design protein -T11 n=1 Tax=synthetic construct TaxID=32630 RepID=UPI0034E05792